VNEGSCSPLHSNQVFLNVQFFMGQTSQMFSLKVTSGPMPMIPLTDLMGVIRLVSVSVIPQG
jgi:hypothetical protein